MIRSRGTVAAAFVILLAISGSDSAHAQAQVRVVKDRATIWGIEARVPLTTVRSGTVLDVVRREGEWFVVTLPVRIAGTSPTGLISISEVEAMDGSRFPPREPGVARQRPASPTRRAAPVVRNVGLFGFGQAGYTAWSANRTFSAIFGDAHGAVYGAGAQARIRDRLFIEGAVDYFKEDGQRVFVLDGEIFPLGVRDTVRIVPVTISAGYRHGGRNIVPYFGGGVGQYFYRETSDFSDPSENISDRFSSYHVLAGVEFGGRSVLRTSVEVQLTTVPDALGTTGASAAFDEHNLGGVVVRLKILAGR